MNKRTLAIFWITALALLSVIGIILFWHDPRSSDATVTTSSQPTRPTSNAAPEPERVPESPPALPAAPVVVSEPSRPVEAESTMAITRVAQPAAVAESPTGAKVQGFGETAVLSDADGKPLLKATPTSPIYSARPSPSGHQLVVSRGSGVHQIYRLTPFALVRELPVTPDVPRASAFEAWHWMDENTLIGISATERPHEELDKLTGAEQEAQWRERTLLYSFNLADGTLSKIDTVKAGLPASFTVVEMHAGGLVKVEWDEQGTARTAWVAARSK